MPGRGELQAGTHKKNSAEVCPKPQTGRSTSFLIAEREEERCKKTKRKKRVVSLLF